jgi:hypothetical protein
MEFRRNPSLYKFRKICLGRAELIRSERQTDVAKLIIACHTNTRPKTIIKQWETKTPTFVSKELAYYHHTAGN